jgi:predicted esterase
MDLSLITIPPTAPHTHTVVFLHGRGDNAQNFSLCLLQSKDSHNRSLPYIFPSFRWVFPQSELRETSAFPGPRVSQWFDIWNTNDFSQNESVQAAGLKQSVASIKRVLAKEADALGGQWDRVVLAGISQGAATSVHTLLNLDQLAPSSTHVPRRLGAFLGFACRMPFPGRTLAATRQVLNLDDGLGNNTRDQVVRNTPVLLEHCVDDQTVLVEKGRALRETLRGFGAQVSWKEYPNGGHWFNAPAGIDDVVEFLNEHVLGKGKEVGGNVLSEEDAMDLS